MSPYLFLMLSFYPFSYRFLVISHGGFNLFLLHAWVKILHSFRRAICYLYIVFSEYVFMFHAHFPISFNFFLFTTKISVCSLYILNTSPLLNLWLASIFSTLQLVFFIFVDFVFINVLRAEFLISFRPSLPNSSCSWSLRNICLGLHSK